MNTEFRNAEAISGMPTGPGGEDGIFYGVGRPYHRWTGTTYAKAGIVSSITVTRDLPSLHTDLERVRVFDGETLIFEAPLHSLEGVSYAAPQSEA